jgi:hypothetical protein
MEEVNVANVLEPKPSLPRKNYPKKVKYATQPWYNKKWTRSKVIKLFDDLLLWLMAEPKNVLFGEFLTLQKGLSKSYIAELSNKFPEVKERLRLAKDIQEMKLSGGALDNRLNQKMAQFLLQCTHGMVPESKMTVEGNQRQTLTVVFEEVKNEQA